MLLKGWCRIEPTITTPSTKTRSQGMERAAIYGDGCSRYGSTGAPADKDDPGVSSRAFTHHALGSEDAFRETTAAVVAVAWPLPPPCHGGVWGRLLFVLHRPRRLARPPPLVGR